MAYVEHEVRVGRNNSGDRIDRLTSARPRRTWYRSLAAISPDQLPRLQLYLDAQALAPADGTPVASWPDLSPNAVPLTQSDPALRPSVAAAGINGKKSVRFGGAGAQSLTATAGAGTKPASGHYHQFIVLSNASRATYVAAGIGLGTYLALFGRPEPAWAPVAGSGFGLEAAEAFVSNTDFSDGAVLPLALLYDTPTIIEAAFDGSTLRAWQDGRLVGSDTLLTPLSSFADGSLYVGGNYLGDVGEVIVFDRVLNEDERLGVTGYLLDRWLVGG